jgi:hypothetical protein
MPGRLSVHRFAALILAISLLLSLSWRFADAGDLGRGQSHGATSVAVGNESDGSDRSRFIRRVYSSITENDFVFPAFTPAFFWLRTAGYCHGAPSKLYRLNVAFLI